MATDWQSRGQSVTQSKLTVIGGGIVGMATALQLQQRHPDLCVTLLEKEPAPALHQTGRNSGVIHAGIYYAPGSLKAEFCKRGLAATLAFSRQHGIAVETCGKLLVATRSDEITRMQALADRGARNGLNLRAVSQSQLAEIEPHITGLGALLSPATGIANYSAITRKMADLLVEAGGEVRYNSLVKGIDERAEQVTVTLSNGSEVTSTHLVVCAGLGADRLAALCGLADDFAIIPFKGEYFRLAPRHDQIVSHLIYPIPDPELPFLGVHLTRMIGGYVTVGPNAVLSLAREDYRKLGVNLTDLLAMAGFPGFWRAIGANFGSGLAEMRRSLSKRLYLESCRRYCPSLELGDLLPHPPGIRAQAVMRDGSLVHDFLIRNTARTVHVCNAPSPAATSAIPIAEYVAERAGKVFGL
jgi:(S)-2-hydroxyglutarate dehydrogenase